MKSDEKRMSKQHLFSILNSRRVKRPPSKSTKKHVDWDKYLAILQASDIVWTYKSIERLLGGKVCYTRIYQKVREWENTPHPIKDGFPICYLVTPGADSSRGARDGKTHYIYFIPFSDEE